MMKMSMAAVLLFMIIAIVLHRALVITVMVVVAAAVVLALVLPCCHRQEYDPPHRGINGLRVLAWSSRRSNQDSEFLFFDITSLGITLQSFSSSRYYSFYYHAPSTSSSCSYHYYLPNPTMIIKAA